ncbi:hypothetical protein HGP17_10775 [Rhizobium sp. P38BS-XIX]|uniref:hypothetical protein n=1 Tax=Rhizobium sp. P38BS-XIX TaxID=2726740 RepID=UPI001456A2B6|nr:hypothetical protein [Rhizobium sp. P38BS-XIX]NLR97313.1 hypothetical protein [Rhizobium sp. P38BS-XIX]
MTGDLSHRIVVSRKTFASDIAAICSVGEGKVSAYSRIEGSCRLWSGFQPD